jgi:hypothetical protein
VNLIEVLATLARVDARWRVVGEDLRIDAGARGIPAWLLPSLAFYRPLLVHLAQHAPDGPWPRVGRRV